MKHGDVFVDESGDLCMCLDSAVSNAGLGCETGDDHLVVLRSLGDGCEKHVYDMALAGAPTELGINIYNVLQRVLTEEGKWKWS